MAEVIAPANILEEIELSDLLPVVMTKKKEGLRLSQACSLCEWQV